VNNPKSFDPDLDNFLLEAEDTLAPPLENNVFSVVCAIFVGSVLTCIAILSFYFVAKNASWSVDEYSTQAYPIKGQYTSIASTDTRWVSVDNPVSDDGLSDKSFYPVTTITLEKTMQSGKLRCYYLNSEEKYTGDPVTASFVNGSFSSSAELTFKCIEGIPSRSDFSAYNSGYLKPWYLVILEGPDDSVTMSDYNELAKIPVYAELPKLTSNN